MTFVHVIFVADKPMIFTNDREKLIQENPIAYGFHMFPTTDKNTINKAIKLLSTSLENGALLEAPSFAALKKIILENYTLVEAGGGVVKNSEGKVLMIYRNDKWDLPKGKLEPGEKIEDCAVREVMEETGLKQITLGSFVENTFHFYALKSQRIIKKTHWYEMDYLGKQKLVPQKEEGITKAQWVDQAEAVKHMKNSFPTIKLVLEKAGIIQN